MIPQINVAVNDFHSGSYKNIKNIVREAWIRLIEDFYEINTFQSIEVYREEEQSKIICDKNSIKLNYGISERDPLFGEDKVYVRSIIFHEFYHLYDRLDTSFGLNTLKDLGVFYEQEHKKIINVLWDIYIENRKMQYYTIYMHS